MPLLLSSTHQLTTVQTSALDTYTEQALLQNINSILKEKARTSIFIAHRLRTIFDSGVYPIAPFIHYVKRTDLPDRSNHSSARR